MLWRMRADLSPGRIGIMFARLDDLPAVPALDGATLRGRTDIDFPAHIRYERIPGRRRLSTRNVISCSRSLIGVTLAETAETGSSRALLIRTTTSSMVPANHSHVHTE